MAPPLESEDEQNEKTQPSIVAESDLELRRTAPPADVDVQPSKSKFVRTTDPKEEVSE
jgi:hypothetical protein